MKARTWGSLPLWGESLLWPPPPDSRQFPQIRVHTLKMKTLCVSQTIALVLAFAGQSAPAAGKPFAWPDGAQAAVSLRYDDAIKSQLDNAIPALNKSGFKGTFNLVLSSDQIRLRGHQVYPRWCYTRNVDTGSICCEYGSANERHW